MSFFPAMRYTNLHVDTDIKKVSAKQTNFNSVQIFERNSLIFHHLISFVVVPVPRRKTICIVTSILQREFSVHSFMYEQLN